MYDRNGKRTAGFPSDEVPDLFAEVKWNQGDKEDHILSDLHNRMYGKENEQLTGKHQKPTSGSDPDRRGYVGQKGWQFL